jgi:hypothetical protein
MRFTKLKFKNNIDSILTLSFNQGFDSFFIKAAIVKYDFFNKFDINGMPFNKIVKKFNIPEKSLNVLLPLFTSFNLLVYRKDKYYLTNYTKEYFLKKSEKNMVDLINFRNFFYPENITFEIISKVLKTGKPNNYMKNSGDWVSSIANNKLLAKTFTSAMDKRGIFLASKLVNKIGLSKNNYLLDIGGSSGIYSCFLAEKFKKLKIDILEIPSVAKNTRLILKKRKFEKRINVIEGDMFKFNSHKKYDVHLYSNVIHDWDVKDVKRLFSHSYKNLPLNGKIIIHDGHLKFNKNNISLMHNNLRLLMFTKGRYYYYHEMLDFLEQAGFTKIKVKKTVSGRSLIIGIKN